MKLNTLSNDIRHIGQDLASNDSYVVKNNKRFTKNYVLTHETNKMRIQTK